MEHREIRVLKAESPGLWCSSIVIMMLLRAQDLCSLHSMSRFEVIGHRGSK